MPQSNVEKASELGDRFRTHFCRTWEQGGECQYLRCMFAHGPQELRTAEQNAVDGLVNPAAVRAFQRREERALKAQAKAQAKAVADAKAFASTEEALSTSSCMRPSHCPSPDSGSSSHTRTHSSCYQGHDAAPHYGNSHGPGYGYGHGVELNGMECYGHGRSYSGQSFTQSYCPSQSQSQSHSRVYSQDDTTTCTPPGHSHSAACTTGYGSGQSGMRRPQGQAFPSQPEPLFAHDHDVLGDGDEAAANTGMVTSTSASASASGAGATVRTHDPYSPAPPPPPPPPPYDYAHCTDAHEDGFSRCHYREGECHDGPHFTNEAIDASPQAAVWAYAPIEPRAGLPPCTAASDPDAVCRCLECVRAHFASASVSKIAAAEDGDE